MTRDTVVSLTVDAMELSMKIGLPLLLAGLIVGLISHEVLRLAEGLGKNDLLVDRHGLAANGRRGEPKIWFAARRRGMSEDIEGGRHQRAR